MTYNNDEAQLSFTFDPFDTFVHFTPDTLRLLLKL